MTAAAVNSGHLRDKIKGLFVSRWSIAEVVPREVVRTNSTPSGFMEAEPEQAEESVKAAGVKEPVKLGCWASWPGAASSLADHAGLTHVADLKPEDLNTYEGWGLEGRQVTRGQKSFLVLARFVVRCLSAAHPACEDHFDHLATDHAKIPLFHRNQTQEKSSRKKNS